MTTMHSHDYHYHRIVLPVETSCIMPNVKFVADIRLSRDERGNQREEGNSGKEVSEKG